MFQFTKQQWMLFSFLGAVLALLLAGYFLLFKKDVAAVQIDNIKISNSLASNYKGKDLTSRLATIALAEEKKVKIAIPANKTFENSQNFIQTSKQSELLLRELYIKIKPDKPQVPVTPTTNQKQNLVLALILKDDSQAQKVAIEWNKADDKAFEQVKLQKKYGASNPSVQKLYQGLSLKTPDEFSNLVTTNKTNRVFVEKKSFKPSSLNDFFGSDQTAKVFFAEQHTFLLMALPSTPRGKIPSLNNAQKIIDTRIQDDLNKKQRSIKCGKEFKNVCNQ